MKSLSATLQPAPRAGGSSTRWASTTSTAASSPSGRCSTSSCCSSSPPPSPSSWAPRRELPLALCPGSSPSTSPTRPNGCGCWLWPSEALRQIVKSGPFSRVIRVARLGAVAVLAFALVQFAIGQLRAAFYPTLAQRAETSWSLNRSSEPPSRPGGERGRFDVAPAAPRPGPGGARRSQRRAARLWRRRGAARPPPRRRRPRNRVGSWEKMREAEVGRTRSMLYPKSAHGDRNPATAPNWTSEVDPTAIVQTGALASPTWSWTSVRLSWSGPVPTGQGFKLWLIPPPVERALNVLRVALTLLLCFLILGPSAGRRPRLAARAQAGSRGLGLPSLLRGFGRARRLSRSSAPDSARRSPGGAAEVPAQVRGAQPGWSSPPPRPSCASASR